MVTMSLIYGAVITGVDTGKCGVVYHWWIVMVVCGGVVYHW